MTKEKVLLKNELFNKETVSLVSKAIKNVYEDFDEKSFTEEIVSQFDKLELKARIHWISTIIRKYLPDSYIESVKILLNSIENSKGEGRFVFSAYPDFVSTYGCNIEHLEVSLKMLGEFTKLSSAEFAIRFFINEFPEAAYKKMYEWSKSENVDQRRLSSEGLRPKLPWAKGIKFEIGKGALPLNNLYYDDVRYVTRSVANHLNDISKTDPMLVLDTLKEWKQSNKQKNIEMDYIISHSLRTLVKKGHKETLQFLGYSYDPKVQVTNLLIEKKNINVGDSISFSFNITAFEDEKLVIDYVVRYPAIKNRNSTKVFKLKKVSLTKGSSIKISKNHAFRLMTTKKLYTGEHSVSIQINGKEFKSVIFNLTV